MTTAPLSYLSLKTVLQHMEANLRFQVALQIPSIRTVERAVPLKIDSLTFDGMKVVVNETEYKLGVIKKYHDDNAYVPNNIQLDNYDGGARCNLDQYGLPDYLSDVQIMTPGDVQIGKSYRERHMEVRQMTEFDIQCLEWQVEQFERVVAQARLQGKEFIEARHRNNQNVRQVADDHLVVGPHGQDIFNQENNGPAWFGWYFARGTPVAKVESMIKDSRAQLLPYQCRRDGRQPPFDMLIQFTKTSTRWKQISRMIYNKKLHDAQKHLNTFLFEKRLFPSQVRCFNVVPKKMVLRLPLGLKFKIQNLRIPSPFAENYEALKSIFEESSFPLNCLNIAKCHDDEEAFGHQVVKSAKKLVSSGAITGRRLAILQNLPNQRVHWKIHDFENEHLIGLIQNWLDTGRQVNTHFSFGITDKQKYMIKLLKLIKQRFNGTISGKRSVTLRMNNYSDLKIFYEADPHPDVRVNYQQWVLEMKVVRKEAE